MIITIKLLHNSSCSIKFCQSSLTECNYC